MATIPDNSGIHRTASSHSSKSLKEKADIEAEPTVLPAVDSNDEGKPRRHWTPWLHAGAATLILGWWITATILKATRHRWIVQTLFAWFFLFLIAFQYIPTTVLTKPIQAVWIPLVQKPFFNLGYRTRLAIGWIVLLATIFGSAFGFPLRNGAQQYDRVISVSGLFLFQLGFWLSSKHRSQVPWPTVIVGLFLQQIIALFVLKTGAGFSIFKWIATLAADFLGQAEAGGTFFFDAEIWGKHWFFVGVLSSIIFFVAFVQMMYYIGVMQWIISKFAWFFFKIMNVSGAEAVVAAASPWVGQGESACLVRPYVDLMTESEIHVTMTSGFSTIAGSVMVAYMSLGVPPETLVTSSVMSIPASLAISKMRLPEIDEPLTRGTVSVDRGSHEKEPPVNVLHAFSQGAVFGLIVAGQILTNVLTVLSLVATINGLMIWIGRGFGIERLTLELVIGYFFYPITFFLGVPRSEILTVSQLFATKLVANEFSAYMRLSELDVAGLISPRAYTIASYGLCGFANLGSLGIQIGVLSALAPSKGKTIARIAFSAMVCGFLSTLQTAAIVGMLL